MLTDCWINNENFCKFLPANLLLIWQGAMNYYFHFGHVKRNRHMCHWKILILKELNCFTCFINLFTVSKWWSVWFIPGSWISEAEAVEVFHSHEEDGAWGERGQVAREVLKEAVWISKKREWGHHETCHGKVKLVGGGWMDLYIWKRSVVYLALNSSVYISRKIDEGIKSMAWLFLVNKDSGW